MPPCVLEARHGEGSPDDPDADDDQDDGDDEIGPRHVGFFHVMLR